MYDLVVSYARVDRAMGERVVAGLERAGYRVAVDRDTAGAARPVDEVALEMRDAQAFVPLISEAALASVDVRQSARIALLYDRRLVPAVLQQGFDAEALAADGPVIAATRFEERPEDLIDALARAVDLSALSGVADGQGGPAIDDGFDANASAKALRSRDPGLRPLIDELERRGVTPRPAGARRPEPNDGPIYDSLGFVKSPETMLARWRQIERSGSIKDFETFELDYEEDPFFATLAAETADQLRRKRSMRMVDLGLRSVIGALFAGLIVWAAAAYCSAETCRATERASNGGSARIVASAGAESRALDQARRQIQDLNAQLAQARQETGALRASLQDAQRALARRGDEGRAPGQAGGGFGGGDDRMRAELERAGRELAQLRGEAQNRERQMSALQVEVERRGREIQRLGAELQSRDQTVALLEGRGVARVTPRQAAVSTPSAGGASGMERIMSFYQERFTRATEVRDERDGSPIFTPQEIKTLQSCLLRRTGRLSQIDGRWGPETTGALLGVTTQEANWVIDCVVES